MKFSFTTTWSDYIYDRRHLVVWTAASAPPGSPTTNWTCFRLSFLLGITRRFAHYAPSLLIRYPIVIGLTSPSFFCSAIRRPSNIILLMFYGKLPASIRFISREDYRLVLQPISSSRVEATGHLVYRLILLEIFLTPSSHRLMRLAKDQVEDYRLDYRRAVCLPVSSDAFQSVSPHLMVPATTWPVRQTCQRRQT